MRDSILAIVLFTTIATHSAASTSFLFRQPNASAAATIAFTETSVSIGGMTPAAQVVLFTASIANTHGFLQERTGAKIFTDDSTGAFTYTSPYGIAPRSVWIAVDVETGRYVAASPSTDGFRLLPFPAQLLKRDTDGILGLFDNDQVTAEMLIVRPKVGAWRLRGLEGGRGDADRAHNGKLSLASAEATPVSGTDPPPRRLKNGDIIAVIDPGRLEVVIVEIGKE